MKHREGETRCSFYSAAPIAGSKKTMPPVKCTTWTQFRCPLCSAIACNEHRQQVEESGQVLCVNCYHKVTGRTATPEQQSARKQVRRKKAATATQVRKKQEARASKAFMQATQWQQYRMYHSKPKTGRCPVCHATDAPLIRKGLRSVCYSCYSHPRKQHRGFVRKHLHKAWRAFF